MEKFLLLFFILWSIHFSEPLKMESPDKKIQLIVKHEKRLQYELIYKNNQLTLPCFMDMVINGKSLADNLTLKNIRENKVDTAIIPIVAVKNKSIKNHYKEWTLEFENHFSIQFRIFNNGFAYRFITSLKDSIEINNEIIELNFPENDTLYFPEEESMFTHQEREYKKYLINEIKEEQFASIPLLVSQKDNNKLIITESNLQDYSGFYLSGSKKDRQIKAIFPYYPDSVNQTSDRDVRVVTVKDYLAKTKGTRDFPWRVFGVAQDDKEIILNEMTALLAEPSRIRGEWIKPGKVAWDWWNANNLYDIDFESGLNTDTYKYYIDFASKNGIEYVILDEGWYDLKDIRKVNPQIDMDELARYSAEKNVGIILWTTWKAIWDHLDEALSQFQKWGVKGIKVDFMQRDDQWMVNYYWKIAEKAAEAKMLVDFHGCYKPAGLRMTYPNVITREGVRGLEQSKWSDWANPEMAVTIPFIRMFAGPLDYTPGAMDNGTKGNFRPMWSRPMSQGTRCHQLAMYVVFESPLQMLADSPSNYLKEKECLEFISQIPTVWDETRVIEASLGDYIIIARKKGVKWYLGGMTDWTERDFQIKLNFLNNGEYKITLMKDGKNADKRAIDYKKEILTVTEKDELSIHCAPGGGFSAIIEPLEKK